MVDRMKEFNDWWMLWEDREGHSSLNICYLAWMAALKCRFKGPDDLARELALAVLEDRTDEASLAALFDHLLDKGWVATKQKALNKSRLSKNTEIATLKKEVTMLRSQLREAMERLAGMRVKPWRQTLEKEIEGS